MPTRRAALILWPALVAAAATGGYVAARADRFDPVVMPQETVEGTASPRGGRGGPPLPGAGDGAPCPQPAPEPGLTCQDGEWLPPADEPRGGGNPWRTSGCLTSPPADGFRCENGVWTMGAPAPAAGARPSDPTSTSTSAPEADPEAARPPTTPPGSTSTPSAQCRGPAPATAPGMSAICVGGSWIVR